MDSELEYFEKIMKDKFCNIFLISNGNYEPIAQENSFDVLKRRFPISDNSKLSTMKKYYLIHTNYSENQVINYDFLSTEINIYSKFQHITLANFKGYMLYDKNNNPVPTIMTERPINGPLISFFESVKKNQKVDDKNFYPFYNLDDINSVSSEQKFVIILGIIAGTAFIHKKNFIHANLNPTTIYLNKYYHPVICDYAFNIPFIIKERNENEKDDENVDESFNEEEEDEEETKKEKDIYNLKPQNNLKFSYYPDTNNENLKFDHPAYVAPEVFNKDPKKCFNELADIYSIGMLIYFILTESEPTFDDEKHVKMPLLDNLNDNWKNLIQKCLSVDPNNRCAAKELFEELTSEKKIGLYLSSIPNSDTNQLSEKAKPFVLFLIQDLQIEEKKISISAKLIPSLAEIEYNDRLIIYAAELGNKECIETIGKYFNEGTHNFLQDFMCAFYCFENSKSRLYSRYQFARYLQEGIGTKKNLNKALEYYQKILDKGDKNDPYYKEIKGDVEKKIKETKDEFESTHTVILKNVPKDMTDKYIKRNFCKNADAKIEKQDQDQQFVTKRIIFQYQNGKNSAINSYKSNPELFNPIILESIKEYEEPEKDIFSSLKKTSVPEVHLGDYTFDDDSYEESGTSGRICVAKGKDGKIYAAKLFFTIESEDYSSINKIKREVILSTKFNQPTILKILGYSSLDLKNKIPHNPTLIMNFIPNGTLEKMIINEHKNKTDPSVWNNTAKLKVIIGIVYAMASIHSKNFIHRDLKTENILLNELLEPVISDFGSSKEFSPNENIAMTRNVGSPAYMAPEVFNSTFSYKWEVDVFSFGIILYQIIKAMPIRVMFPLDDVDKFFNDYVKNEIRPPLDDMPQLFKELVESCWNNQIDARPDFQTIKNKLIEAVEKKENLLPDVDVEKVKEYINRLEKDDK